MLLYCHTTKWCAEFNRNRVTPIHKQFATFYVVILTILHISHHSAVTSLPVGFSHAKVQRSSGVKYHYANGSWIYPAAFRKSKMDFQSPASYLGGLGIP